MNTKVLLLGIAIASFATTTFASDALLSPRAKDTQIKVVTAAPAESSAVSYVETIQPVSPRVAAAQIKVVKGVYTDRNPALECRNNMPGSPRAVTACAQSATMPGCQKLATK